MRPRRTSANQVGAPAVTICGDIIHRAGTSAKLARQLAREAPERNAQSEDSAHVLLLDRLRSLIVASELLASESGARIREAFRLAILHEASGLVFCTSRQRGVTPRDADFLFTRALVRAGDVLGIELLDHVIVDADEYYSYRELGTLGRDARST